MESGHSVHIGQMVALGSVSETDYYGELQGLQALVDGGKWSLDTSGR